MLNWVPRIASTQSEFGVIWNYGRARVVRNARASRTYELFMTFLRRWADPYLALLSVTMAPDQDRH
jgi:hypothetical protein